MPSTNENEKPEKSASSKAPATDYSPNTVHHIKSFMSSPGAKFILLGVIMFALLIPTFIVWGLVEERAKRANTVAKEISQGWGGTQIINGPYLVIPYLKYDKVPLSSNNNSQVTQKFVTNHAIFSPEKIDMTGKIDVQERSKSIYKTQLYHMKSGFKGRFSKIDLNRIKDEGGVPKPENAFLVIGISDTTGFRSDIRFNMNGKNAGQFLPGLNNLGNAMSTLRRQVVKVGQGSGVHIPIDAKQAVAGFSFEVEMALNGSRKLAFVPAGKTTKLDLASNWPHPGFAGKFLPEARSIDEKGFSATWTIPNLARGIDDMQLSSRLPHAGTSIGVNFVEPLSFYQVTSRSLKYAIGVFSLVFLAVFVLEFSSKSSLHWIQYILTGLAMIVFYVLLLALAEQVGFFIAYLSAAVATTALIAWYIGDALGNKNGTLIVGGVLATTYLVLYLTLNEETYALLAGSLIAFIAIAATMFATRKIDWSGNTNQAIKT